MKQRSGEALAVTHLGLTKAIVRRRFLPAVFCGIVFWPGAAISQAGQDPVPSGSIAAIVSEKTDHVLQVFAAEPQKRIVLMGNSFQSLRPIQYMDSVRATPPERLDLIRRWVRTYGIEPAILDEFQSEYLFREDGLAVWLPVQSPLIHYLETEVSRDDAVKLYLVWVGARGAGPEIDWLFVVYGMQKE